jgi:Right handed beta helix region
MSVRRLLVVVAAGAAIGLIGTGGVQAAPLTCGSTITGSVYTLHGNLVCTAGASVALTMIGGVLDLNGFSIIGPGGVGVETHGWATVENGTIRGFGTGIDVPYDAAIGNDGVFDRVRLTGNGYGIMVGPDSSATITNSFVNENSSDGVALSGVEASASISQTQILRNGGNGVGSYRSRLSAIGNVISGNRGYGIYQTGWGVVISGNQVNNNGLDGIFSGLDTYPDSWTITNNTAVGNGGHGIDFEGHGPAPFYEYPPVTFEGNVAHDNNANPQCINIFCRSF